AKEKTARATPIPEVSRGLVSSNPPANTFMSKIVIVDDEPLFRRVLAAKLKAVGHTVFEAGDGKAGEKLIIAEQPDLVLLDVWMPEQDGIATIVNVRKHAPEVKVIVMSGEPKGAGLRLFEIANTLG